MAINYTTLFQDVGSILQGILRIRAVSTGTAEYSGAGAPNPSLPTVLSHIETVLTTNGRYDILSGIPDTVASQQDAAIAWCNQLAASISARLTQRDTVLEQLPVGDDNAVQDVLVELIRDMQTNSQNVQKCTVTLGSISSSLPSSANGTLLISKVLDGISPPGLGFPANLVYAGLASELGVSSETMTLTCILDSNGDGLADGSEVFQWNGSPSNNSALDWRAEGSGNGPQVPTLNAQTGAYVLNPDFQSFTGSDPNAPDNWTILSGTTGTNILKATASADIYRGSSALKLVGDGATQIKLTQAVTAGSLVGRKRYALAGYIESDIGSGDTGTLTIDLEDPLGNQVGGTGILIAPGSYGSGFHLWSTLINLPASVPDTVSLVIRTNAVTNTRKIVVGSLAFAPVSWHGGINACIVAGNAKFARGDRFSFTVSNDNAGLFQTFFRKDYKVQLPSASTPTIPDTYVTT